MVRLKFSVTIFPHRTTISKVHIIKWFFPKDIHKDVFVIVRKWAKIYGIKKSIKIWELVNSFSLINVSDAMILNQPQTSWKGIAKCLIFCIIFTKISLVSLLCTINKHIRLYLDDHTISRLENSAFFLSSITEKCHELPQGY